MLKIESLRELDINKKLLLTIVDLSYGKEDLTLNLYNTNLVKILTIPSVGETAKINETSLYYCKAEGIFWFNEIMCIDIKTQKSKSLYKETDKKYVLRIEKPKNQNDIFVKRTSAIYQDIGLINGDNIQWYERGFGTKKPICLSVTAFDTYFKIKDIRVTYPGQWKLVDAYKRDDNFIDSSSFKFQYSIFDKIMNK